MGYNDKVLIEDTVEINGFEYEAEVVEKPRQKPGLVKEDYKPKRRVASLVYPGDAFSDDYPAHRVRPFAKYTVELENMERRLFRSPKFEEKEGVIEPKEQIDKLIKSMEEEWERATGSSLSEYD